jgi:hypothetical protein
VHNKKLKKTGDFYLRAQSIKYKCNKKTKKCIIFNINLISIRKQTAIHIYETVLGILLITRAIGARNGYEMDLLPLFFFASYVSTLVEGIQGIRTGIKLRNKNSQSIAAPRLEIDWEKLGRGSASLAIGYNSFSSYLTERKEILPDNLTQEDHFCSFHYIDSSE